MFVVATATIAAIAGGGGLGDIIVNQAAYALEGVVGAAICVSVSGARGGRATRARATSADAPGAYGRALYAFEPDVSTGPSRGTGGSL